jgi:hypothetical protein
MEKITLNDNCKRLLKEIKSGSYQEGIESDLEDLNFLNTKGLINAIQTLNGYVITGLTDEGRAYLHSNPDLKNPSIWDDWKYWINTAISVFALIVAIIALFKN